MDVKNRNILVVGMGVSGIAAARFLKKLGGRVVMSDQADERQLGQRLASVKEMGIHVELGPHNVRSFENADLIVISPGIPHTLPILVQSREKGIDVIGEVELASRFIKEPIVAVTGTNGKTTTTMLIGQMMVESGLKVFVGGNIGTPLIEYADSQEKADRIVAEVSSFQLDTIVTFRPQVSVLLNITEDHLDRYADFDAYAASKARIFENQKGDDTAILNGGDPVCLSLAHQAICRKAFFYHQNRGNSIAEKTETAGLIQDDGIILRAKDDEDVKVAVPASRFPGRHNRENVAAACLAAHAAGGTIEGIQGAINSFDRLSHRLESVASFNGIHFIDDSKATNVDAVVKALTAFNSPVILILGGRNKGNDFHPLKKPVKDHCKRLILMGEAKEAIHSVLGHTVDSETANTMEEAVEKAFHGARAGDVVLLSPACASFDMFKNYAERGEVFQQCVERLRKTRETAGQ